MGFTIWIELRISRGEDVNVVPLFTKILEQVGNVDHVPVVDDPVAFSHNANIHDLALMASAAGPGQAAVLLCSAGFPLDTSFTSVL